MSRRTETRTRTVTEEVLAEVRCDLCGRKTSGVSCDGETDWATEPGDMYNTDTITIRRDCGVSYPESASGERVFFDICPDCFAAKVVPALEALGAKPITEEWER